MAANSIADHLLCVHEHHIVDAHDGQRLAIPATHRASKARGASGVLRLCDLELHRVFARGQLAYDQPVDPVANGTILRAGHALDTEFFRRGHADLNDFLFRISCLGHRLFACGQRGSWQANIRSRFVSCSHTTSYIVIHARSRARRTHLDRMRR